MKHCQFAGAQCPNEATVTIRAAGVGDRSVCSMHVRWMEQAGMAFRILEPGFVPAWRRADLRRDMTGRILA